MSESSRNVARRVFFHLHQFEDKDERIFELLPVDVVMLPSVGDIFDFRNALKAQRAATLESIDSAQLLIYENMRSFERNDRVEDLLRSIGDQLGRQISDPVIVVVPSESSIIALRSRTSPLSTGRLIQSQVDKEVSQHKSSVDANQASFEIPVHKRRRLVPSTEAQSCESGSSLAHLFYIDIGNVNELGDFLNFNYPVPYLKLKNIFIRESYRTIAATILSNEPDRSGNPLKVMITGTPGLGKSFFLIYLLWRLVKEKKRVLFIYHPHKTFYDSDGSVYVYSTLPDSEDEKVWNSRLWCLFDAKAKGNSDLDRLPYDACSFVLSTSPKPELIYDFKKPPTPTNFYMPVWSEQEMARISSMFPSATDWRRRLEFLGGIPRFVFEDIGQSPTEIIQQACQQCSLDDCIQITGSGSTNENKAVHVLVHISSDHPYTTPFVRFASEEALKIIVNIKRKECRRRMHDLLEFCHGFNHVVALAGQVFKHYAIETLTKGGRFEYWELKGGETCGQLVIPASACVQYESDLRCDQTINQLYVPTDRNLIGFDAWIPGVGAFRMTVTGTNEICGAANEKLALLGQEANKLYWLLLPEHYKDFKIQSLASIPQYAVLIPYPERSLI